MLVVLLQGKGNSGRTVSFASRTLSDTELSYSTVEKEMLAITCATKYFRAYLFGQKFKVRTDHKPLKVLMIFKEPKSKLVRWKFQLIEWDYEVKYKIGFQNLVADAFSRVNLEMNTHSVDWGKYEIKSSETPLNEFNIQ